MTFNFRPAKSFTDRHGLFVGLTGPTNSGKTFTALRLARGIAGPKGKIAVIDTEGGRTLHLKDHFDFDASLMDPPFRPHFFSEGAKAAEDAGYDCCLIDSFSMEWVGIGGVLDWQEKELDTMVERAKARNDRRSEYQIREAGKMAAWIKPKGEHKAMVYSFLQRRMPIIFAIRGEETVKPGEAGEKPTKLFKSICSPTFPFEITVSFRLATEAKGIIDLSDAKSYKMEGPHEAIFRHGEQITEAHGAALAAWARGEGADAPSATSSGPEQRYPTLFGVKDGRAWLGNLSAALATVETEVEVAEIGGLSSVVATLQNAPPEVRSQVTDMLAEAMARVQPAAPEFAGDPENETETPADEMAV